MADRYICGDYGYRPVGSGRPPINICPQCRGDFTWTPVQDEHTARSDDA